MPPRLPDDDQLYTRDQLDSAVKTAVSQVEYQGSIERRLANLEDMTRKANNLKSDIIDLIHKVDDGQRARIQMVLDTVSNHASLPGHPLGIDRLDELEVNLARFGFEGIGDDDAVMLAPVLDRAAELHRRKRDLEPKAWQAGITTGRLVAATSLIGAMVSTATFLALHH